MSTAFTRSSVTSLSLTRRAMIKQEWACVKLRHPPEINCIGLADLDEHAKLKCAWHTPWKVPYSSHHGFSGEHLGRRELGDHAQISSRKAPISTFNMKARVGVPPMRVRKHVLHCSRAPAANHELGLFERSSITHTCISWICEKEYVYKVTTCILNPCGTTNQAARPDYVNSRTSVDRRMFNRTGAEALRCCIIMVISTYANLYGSIFQNLVLSTHR